MRKPLSLSLRSIRSPRSVCGFSKNRSDIWLASRINEGKRSTLLFLSSRFFHFSSLSVLFSTLKFLGEKRETEDNCRNSGTVHFERITVDFSILKLEGKRKKEERVILPLFFDSQIRWRKRRNKEREEIGSVKRWRSTCRSPTKENEEERVGREPVPVTEPRLSFPRLRTVTQIRGSRKPVGR